MLLGAANGFIGSHFGVPFIGVSIAIYLFVGLEIYLWACRKDGGAIRRELAFVAMIFWPVAVTMVLFWGK